MDFRIAVRRLLGEAGSSVRGVDLKDRVGELLSRFDRCRYTLSDVESDVESIIRFLRDVSDEEWEEMAGGMDETKEDFERRVRDCLDSLGNARRLGNEIYDELDRFLVESRSFLEGKGRRRRKVREQEEDDPYAFSLKCGDSIDGLVGEVESIMKDLRRLAVGGGRVLSGTVSKMGRMVNELISARDSLYLM